MLGARLSSGVPFKPETDIPSLSGKVILITGGNIGLGLESALQIAKHDPLHIYLCCRTESKALSAISTIKESVPNAPISFLQCDLTSFPSIVSCAKAFAEKSERLDILFLNAGIMAVPPTTTEQGYEVQFGTNHMGHFLLTKLLLPILLNTAKEENSDVRVISLSSMGHRFAPTGGILFSELKTAMKGYWTFTLYGQSKLSNILFAKGLQDRFGEQGITATSLHPGVVNTNLYETTFGGWGIIGKLGFGVKKYFYTSVQDGAKNQLWAAFGKKGDAKGEVEGGEYYMPVGITGGGNKYAYDEKLVDELWAWSEKEVEEYSL